MLDYIIRVELRITSYLYPRDTYFYLKKLWKVLKGKKEECFDDSEVLSKMEIIF